MKYSLRSLMIVVTLAAIALGVFWENRRVCLECEREHARKADQLEEKVRMYGENVTFDSQAAMLYVQYQRQARDHRALAGEYRQASWYPWNRLWIDDPAGQEATP